MLGNKINKNFEDEKDYCCKKLLGLVSRVRLRGDNVADVAVTEYPKEFNLRTAIKLKRRFLKV